MDYPKPVSDKTSHFTVGEANAFASGLATGLGLLATVSYFLFFRCAELQRQSEPILL